MYYEREREREREREIMGTAIIFANQKGGVGKTTSAISIGAALAEKRKNVLLIDFDPQANLSSGVGIAAQGKGIYEVISGNCAILEIIRPTAISGLSVAPSDINLSGATIELIDADKRECILQQIVEKIINSYDYILIDSPPSLGILTINGIVAAHQVLVPLQCEYFALEGLAQLLSSIQRIQNSLNPNLKILGILCTMYDARTRLAQDVVKEVMEHFGKLVFKTIIPRTVRLSEAPSHAKPITLYDSASQGAASYRALSQELIKRVE